MTKEEQHMIESAVEGAHIEIDIAGELLHYLISSHFEEAKPNATMLTYNYERIQNELYAISTLLDNGRTELDFVTGEKTHLTEGYIRHSNELKSYHGYHTLAE